MASVVGMTRRAGEANERIDAALSAMAAGSDVPAAPAKTRDPLLDNVLRLEWIADTLEAMNRKPASKPAPKRSTAKKASTS